jgi:hypothetical protein
MGIEIADSVLYGEQRFRAVATYFSVDHVRDHTRRQDAT